VKIVLTGAAGFVGSHLAQALLATGEHQVVLIDQHFTAEQRQAFGGAKCLAGSFADADILADGVDALMHLAAVPGGAAEANPQLSKQVNLGATLALFETAAAAATKLRVIYASTVAVLGEDLPPTVKDSMANAPGMTYGTHKAMIELALADMHRRGVIEAFSLRLPGILPRPFAPSGLKSAFLSDVFHVLAAGKEFVMPMSAQATSWLMSVHQCVANFMLALTADSSLMPKSRAVTLPALRCTMGDLIEQICAQTEQPTTAVSYELDALLEQQFGALPKLAATAAEAVGFSHDGDLATLVSRGLQLTERSAV